MLFRTSGALGLIASLVLAPACAVDKAEVGDEELESQSQGAKLFNQQTFGGNGRTCKTCHPGEGSTGTLNPAEIQALPANDALFQHDAADVIGGNTFNRIKEHATILIDMPLPPTVSIVGSSARNVILPRGIPTTMNTPALDPVLMYDGRHPTLQVQARAAIAAHAQSASVTDAQLDAIASYQQTLFNSPVLEAFADDGDPITMPFGVTDAEKRGRRWFIDDDKTAMDDVGESKFNVCGFCHSGDMLNGLSSFFVTNIAPPIFAEGDRFFTVLVSEFNSMGNPVYDFEFSNPDGTTTVVPSPDPGIFLLSGTPPPLGNGFFKIPTVWGVKHTAPYFHDNSSKNLVELMEHYDAAIFVLSETDNPETTLGQVDLTEQDKADIIAYMNLL